MTTMPPWCQAAMEALPETKGLRILMLTCEHPDMLQAVARRAGSKGSVTLVEPDDARAAAALGAGQRVAGPLRMAPIEVIAQTPAGSTHFGSFDVVVSAPLRVPPWPRAVWGQLAHRNLRPGGRLVLDLPAPASCDPLVAAWNRVAPEGVTPGASAAEGIDPQELTRSLREAGLRSVEGHGTQHVMGFRSLGELAELGLHVLGLQEGCLEDLQRGLMEHFQTALEEPVETVMRRTQVRAMR